MVLSTYQFKSALRSKLKCATREVIVFSAFLKENALIWLLDNTKAKNISVVSRWEANDLVYGMSDLSCFEICRDRGVKFGISSTLHAKVYYIDGHVLLGSANATARGLALSTAHNDEFGTSYVANKSDQINLMNYLRSVVWVNEDFYTEIKNDYSRMPQPIPTVAPRWSDSVQTKLKKQKNHIWVHELPFIAPDQLLSGYKEGSYAIQHDLELFGIKKENFTLDQAIMAYKNSHAYRWCYDIVRSNEPLSFGRFTKILHDALLDDPIPYRKEVKELAQVLFNWAKLYPTEFKVTRPNYSEVIQIVKDV